MRVTGIGHLLFAIAFAGLGVLSICSGDFALVWQPVPAWVPWRMPLAELSGLVLLVGGLGLLVRHTAAVSALVLTADFLIWLLLLRLPPVLAHPVNESVWAGLGETMLYVTGGWVLFASLAERSVGVTAARVVYAGALPVIGLSHFVYIQATTDLVPAWLPARMVLAYIAGALQIAAGLGLLLRVLPRASATLEALLISTFTVLVWIPRVAASPRDRFEWTAMLVSSALAGAAWVVARSLRPPVSAPGRLVGTTERPNASRLSSAPRGSAV